MLYQRIFGSEYPYGKLDLIDDPTEALSGQAPAGLVYIGSGYRGTQRGPRQMNNAQIERFGRYLVAHEVAHQWWGTQVAAAGSRHRWFEEALAEYSSALYAQQAYGVKEYLAIVEDWRQEVLGTEMPASIQDAESTWDGDQGGAYGPMQASAHVSSSQRQAA